MCGGMAEYPGKEDIPKPRSAEQLRKAAIELQQRHKKGIYFSIQEDYFR